MAGFIKICGVREADAAIAAARAGASHVGFVFFQKSPRHIDAAGAEAIVTEMKQASYELDFAMPELVGLFVDAGESALAETAPFLTHFQFHGHENPERCRAMGAEFGVEVIKALPVGGAPDLSAAAAFFEAADLLIFDARPPKGAERPGGHGEPFDWAALKEYSGETPFLVAGGLTPGNVGEAVAAVKAMPAFAGVDVSSGVEAQPGVKDPALIDDFIKAAKAAF